MTFGSEPTLFAAVIVKSNRDLSSNSLLSNQEKKSFVSLNNKL